MTLAGVWGMGTGFPKEQLTNIMVRKNKRIGFMATVVSLWTIFALIDTVKEAARTEPGGRQQNHIEQDIQKGARQLTLSTSA